jgi:hypothetical protein
MPDRKNAEVESYKLGPKEKQFMKRFKEIARAEAYLQSAGQKLSIDMKNVISLYGEVRQEKQRLMAIPPQVNEIPGQNFEDEDETEMSPDQSWHINY